MTKSQSKQAFDTASSQNATDAANAQTSYNAAQKDVGQYEGALSQYSAANPFTQGGQYQTSQNQGLADTAAAGAQSTAQAIQSAGVRSGQNPAAGIAAAEQVAESAGRNQAKDVAEANQSRMSQGAQYGSNILSASAKPEEMEASLTTGQNQSADATLGDEQKASETPSFWQQLGPALISGGAQLGSAGIAKCWIAARLFGGWEDRRTVIVRLWMNQKFCNSWYGKYLMRLYGRWGQSAADRWMPRSAALTWTMKKVFERALVEAELWIITQEGGDAYRAYCLFEENYRGDWPDEQSKTFSDRAVRFALGVL